MNQWIDIASKFGIPVVMLALLAYFLARKVWPFVTKQIEDAQSQRKEESARFASERKAEIDKFTDALRSRDVLATEAHRENLKALESITNEFRGFREEFRNRYQK